jgi:glycosyltransferase, family 1
MSQKTKVLFVTASTTGGGAERMLFNIIRSMDKAHEARLFITSDAKVPEAYKNDVISVSAGKRHAMSAFVDLLYYIKNYKPEHVFTTSSNVGYMLILIKRLLGAQYKVYIRCAVTPSEIYQNDLRSKVLAKVNRLTYNGAQLVIAQTEFMRRDLIRAYNIKSEKVKAIRNIADVNFVKSQAEVSNAVELKPTDFNIVAAGALYSVKGFDILIEAVAPLIKDSDKHLYILGEERYESGYRAFLEGLIHKFEAEQNIHLIGQKTNPYPYFKAADLLVMSSRKEGYPNVVLEALTLETPVVVSDCVDWSDVVIEGQNGFVAEKNNVASLRNALEKAFSNRFGEIRQIDNYNYNDLFS